MRSHEKVKLVFNIELHLPSSFVSTFHQQEGFFYRRKRFAHVIRAFEIPETEAFVYALWRRSKGESKLLRWLKTANGSSTSIQWNTCFPAANFCETSFRSAFLATFCIPEFARKWMRLRVFILHYTPSQSNLFAFCMHPPLLVRKLLWFLSDKLNGNCVYIRQNELNGKWLVATVFTHWFWQHCGRWSVYTLS